MSKFADKCADELVNKPAAQENPQRRAFLKGAAVAGVALGAGVAAGQAVADAGETADSAGASDQPVAPKGYRETEHIRDYYRSARF